MTGLNWYCKFQVVPIHRNFSKVKSREDYFTTIQNYGICQQAVKQIVFFCRKCIPPDNAFLDFLSILYLTGQADMHTYKGP